MSGFTSDNTCETVSVNVKIEKIRIFMACRTITTIAFHGIESIYIYSVSLLRLCVVYVVKEVASFPGAWTIKFCPVRWK